MTSVHITEIRWRTTLPCRIVPLPNEWLPGFLLRCDQVNHWSAGTITRMLTRLMGNRGWAGTVNYITAQTIDFQRFADMLAINEACLQELTYVPQLQRIFGNPLPATTLLGNNWFLRVCPLCLCEKQTLFRYTCLPYITSCPIHHIRYQRSCSCGARLKISCIGHSPFCCSKCGLPWGHLPMISSDENISRFEERIVRICQWFLFEGNIRLVTDTIDFLQAFTFTPEHVGDLIYLPWKRFLSHSRRRHVGIGPLSYFLAQIPMEVEEMKQIILQQHWKHDPIVPHMRIWHGKGKDYWLGPPPSCS
jgi:TniQ